MNFETLGLKENPFRLTPPLNPKDIIWAGMQEIKAKIEQRISMSLVMNPSRIIINWGNYGSGKTHTALYYSKTDRLNELVTEKKVEKAKSIKITLPRATNNVVQEFLRSFLGQYSLEDIHYDFMQIKDKLGEETLIQMINTYSSDSIISDIFKSLINTQQDDKYFEILKNYIYGDSSKGTLNSLSLPFGLNNDEQIANFLATIINCITYEKQYYSAFFVWIDEFEDIDTLNKSNQERITIFLRQFIDKTPNNLTIFINLTQKAFMNIEDLSMYLGEALTSRAKVQIDFSAPTTEQAKDYVKELIQLFSIDAASHVIDDATIEYVLTHIGNLTARKINESFSIILEMALFSETNKISKEFIDSIKDEIISWEPEYI